MREYPTLDPTTTLRRRCPRYLGKYSPEHVLSKCRAPSTKFAQILRPILDNAGQIGPNWPTLANKWPNSAASSRTTLDKCSSCFSSTNLRVLFGASVEGPTRRRVIVGVSVGYCIAASAARPGSNSRTTYATITEVHLCKEEAHCNLSIATLGTCARLVLHTRAQAGRSNTSWVLVLQNAHGLRAGTLLGAFEGSASARCLQKVEQGGREKRARRSAGGGSPNKFGRNRPHGARIASRVGATGAF